MLYDAIDPLPIEESTGFIWHHSTITFHLCHQNFSIVTSKIYRNVCVSSNGWQLGMKCIENVDSFRYLHSKPKIKIFRCLMLKIISSTTSKTESIVEWTLNILIKNCDSNFILVFRVSFVGGNLVCFSSPPI